MSQATVARKERRKRYFAKLKHYYNNKPIEEQGYVNHKPHSHALYVEAFDIAQQIAACTQKAFVEGFHAGIAKHEPNVANTSHAVMQKKDKLEIGIQTELMDSRLLESLRADESGMHRELTGVTDCPRFGNALWYQQGNTPGLESKQDRANVTHDISDEPESSRSSYSAGLTQSSPMYLPSESESPASCSDSSSCSERLLNQRSDPSEGKLDQSCQHQGHETRVRQRQQLSTEISAETGACEIGTEAVGCVKPMLHRDEHEPGAGMLTTTLTRPDLLGRDSLYEVTPTEDAVSRTGQLQTEDTSKLPVYQQAAADLGNPNPLVKNIPIVMKKYCFKRKPVHAGELARQLREFLEYPSQQGGYYGGDPDNEFGDYEPSGDSEEEYLDDDDRWMRTKSSLIEKYQITRLGSR